MEYGLIGEHLGHSWSKEIHQMLAKLLLSDAAARSESYSCSENRLGESVCGMLLQYKYELREIERSALQNFLVEGNFCAVNVTIPYKEAVIPLLSRLSSEADAIGAVNVILNRNSELIGHNSDYYGFQMLAKHAGISFDGKRVLILGAGGASKAVRAVAVDGGAVEVVHAVRHLPNCYDNFDTGESAPLNNVTIFNGCTSSVKYILYSALEDEYDIIINTTPVGMYPNVEGRILDLDSFRRAMGVLDCIYNPVETNLVLDAKKRGIPAQGGLYMLVAQAVKAFELFLDLKINCAYCIDSIYKELFCATRSL